MSPPKDGDPAWELGVPPGVPLRRVSSAHASPLTLRTDRWRVIFRTLPLTDPHLLSLSFPVVTLALRWSLTHPFTGSWVMMLQEGKGLDSKGQVNTPTCNSSGMPYTRATSNGRPVPWVKTQCKVTHLRAGTRWAQMVLVLFSHQVASDSFETPWATALQASLSLTLSRGLLTLVSIESVMPSSATIFSFRRMGKQHGNDDPGDSGDFGGGAWLWGYKYGLQVWERKRIVLTSLFKRGLKLPHKPSLPEWKELDLRCLVSPACLAVCCLDAFITALFRRGWRTQRYIGPQDLP